MPREKDDKKAEGFQILCFHWLFSSDIMAVKGLKGNWTEATSQAHQ